MAESQGIRQGLRGGWVEQILATLLEKPYRGEMVYFEGAVGMSYTPHHMCGHESVLGTCGIMVGATKSQGKHQGVSLGKA